MSVLGQVAQAWETLNAAQWHIDRLGEYAYLSPAMRQDLYRHERERNAARSILNKLLSVEDFTNWLAVEAREAL